MSNEFELFPKKEELLSAEDFLALASDQHAFENVNTVDFQLNDKDPKDFGAFKVTYQDPIYGDPEWLMEM